MAVAYNNRKQGAPSVMKRVLSGPPAGKLTRPGSGPMGPAAKSSNMVKPKKTAPTRRPNALTPPSGGVFRTPAPSATYPTNTPKPVPRTAVTKGSAGPRMRPGQVPLQSGGVNFQGGQ